VPVLSIVFVNYNSPWLLEQALASLARNRPRFPLEVVVVDNASTMKPRPERMANSVAASSLRWIFNPTNQGYAAAANQGIAVAQGEYVAIANTDIVFLPGTLDSLVEFMQANPEAGVVSPQFLWADMTPQPTARRYPSFRYLLAGRRSPLGCLWPDRRETREFLYAGIEHRVEPTPVETVIGAFMMAPRVLLQTLGGFDEQYWFYVEDADLCRRVAEAGKKVYVLPQARMIHYLGVARRQAGARAEFQRLRSFYRYFLKEYPRVTGTALLLLFGGYLALTSARMLLGLREWEYSQQHGRTR
jgi:hypothetical protein